jgi:hypothetical protein
MKIKSFSFDDPKVDEKVNRFLEEHEGDLDQKGMYIDVSSRVMFVYDDGDLEGKVARATHRMLEEKLVQESVRLVGLRQQSWEAKRGAASGTVKPDDLVRVHNEEAVCEAKVDYLREKLNGFIQHA